MGPFFHFAAGKVEFNYMNIHIIENPDTDQLLSKVSAGILEGVVAAWSNGRDAHIVVTGGRTGLAIVNSLDTAIAAIAHSYSDRKIHIWFSDERFVEFDSADRNDTALIAGFATIAEHAIFHRVKAPSTASLQEAADDYAAQIFATLGSAQFDGVILSMGEDGHVASCFPGHRSTLTSQSPATLVEHSPKPPAQRVTISLNQLAATPQAFIFALGQAKSEALHDTLRRSTEMPIELLRQNSSVGQISIMTDFQVAQ